MNRTFYPGRPEIETRRIALAGAELELRADGQADGAKAPMIVGYASVFDSLSEDLGGFREIVKPGAFTRSLRDGADVRALVDHDPSRILGRSSAGTLRMQVNAKGLRVEIDPPDTTTGRDILTSINRGDVDGMSFAFRTVLDEWRMEGPVVIRELLDVDLVDASVVTFPAYPATEVGVRSLEAYRKAAAGAEAVGHAGLMRMRLRLAEVA